MFTGIIEELGKISSLNKNANGAKVKIAAKIVTKDTNEGDSIAVNGVCLTALEISPSSFSADVSQETLDRSTLATLSIGSVVNLERAVTPTTRLGGHIVQGHVDATGKFLSATQSGDFWTVRIGFRNDFAKYLVFKGSVSVEGISLTVANLADNYFEIAVIPKTWNQTNFSTLKSGDNVNLEADVIGKYVERMMLFGKKDGEITMEKLQNMGYA
jgi:riboflavin synthase